MAVLVTERSPAIFGGRTSVMLQSAASPPLSAAVSPVLAPGRHSLESLELLQSPGMSPVPMPQALLRARTHPPSGGSSRPVTTTQQWQPVAAPSVPASWQATRVSSTTVAPGLPVAAPQGIIRQAVIRSPLVRPQADSTAQRDNGAGLPEPALPSSAGLAAGKASTQGAGTGAAGAPSAALVAAVQMAAAACSAPIEGLNWVPQLPAAGSNVLQAANLTAGLRQEQWNPATSSFRMEASPLLQPARPAQSCATSHTFAPARARGQLVAQAGDGARRRWASISDDDASASPMLWPMRSPVLRFTRSRGGTPLCGPATTPGGGYGTLATVSERLQAETTTTEMPETPRSPFMLPQAQPPAMPFLPVQPQQLEHFIPAWGGYAPLQQAPAPLQMQAIPQMQIVHQLLPGVPQVHFSAQHGFLPVAQAMELPPDAMWPPRRQQWAPQPQPQIQLHQATMQPLSAPLAGFVPATNLRPYEGVPCQAAMVSNGWGPPAVGSGQGRPAGNRSRNLSGWTVVWVGERAFRAHAATKEQIEQAGFLVKVFRSHDRCVRALDKRNSITPMTTFLLSQDDALPMLSYLTRRRASCLHVVVDLEGRSPLELQGLLATTSCPEETSISLASSWEEVLAFLHAINAEAWSRMPQGPACGAGHWSTEVEHPVPPSGWSNEVLSHTIPEGAQSGPASSSEGAVVSELPWTLVWISDQAFKPAAVTLKTCLEALGCQVKGYKTNKNAARALDKKRALVRTVVLVSGTEAAAFIAYLSSRPELSATPIVVEACARGVPVRESATCQVVEGFEAAVAAVRRIASAPGFA